MAFKDLMEKRDLMGTVKELTGTATEAAGKLVDELSEALPTMRALGFTVTDLQVGMGLTPKIGAKLTASTDTVDVERIKGLIKDHSENQTLVGALKALELAYNIKKQIGDCPFTGVEIDLTLGLPPHIGVGFITSAPAAAQVAG